MQVSSTRMLGWILMLASLLRVSTMGSTSSPAMRCMVNPPSTIVGAPDF
eukprot:CAMPEP_0173207528 /NCGR_PEP_ID=MMETSP1141-20130122/21981_1 /TAXON_ID=483371 /ORGANISM="non described non described, Strain CCMP2298" /LENGTH=48 /DNA_ID= /DNA_START= /DNA_END= /DNA_ORIENTATION=